jgi:hypothetical protein
VRSVRSQTGQSPSTPLLRTIPPPPPTPSTSFCSPARRSRDPARVRTQPAGPAPTEVGTEELSGAVQAQATPTVQPLCRPPTGPHRGMIISRRWPPTVQAQATHSASHRMNHPRGGHTPTAGAHSSTRQLKQNSSCSPGPLPLLEEERPRARQRAERAPAA